MLPIAVQSCCIAPSTGYFISCSRVDIMNKINTWYFAHFRVQALLQDSSARLQAAKQDAEAKNAETIAELEKFRRAFTGDTLGWAAATDEKGKPYYYNSETGEHVALFRKILRTHGCNQYPNQAPEPLLSFYVRTSMHAPSTHPSIHSFIR